MSACSWPRRVVMMALSVVLAAPGFGVSGASPTASELLEACMRAELPAMLRAVGIDPKYPDA